MDLIQECIKLNEELSVSLDVNHEMAKLYPEIQNLFNNMPFRKKYVILRNGIKIEYGIKHIILTKNPPIFNEVTNIVINFITSYGDTNNYGQLKNTFNFQCRFNDFDDLIEIRVPCMNENPDYAFLIKKLSHELEHAFQNSKYTTVGKYDEYTKATNNLYNQNEIERNVAILYYTFSKKEIDATIQEIFNLINAIGIDNLNDIYELNDIKEFQARSNLLYSYFINNKNLNDIELNNVLKKYNLNKNTFISYVERGINYFKLKLGKALTFYLGKLKEEKNGIVEMVDRMIYLMNY